MLGYMTEDQARKNGFTHHGSYYGIPIWITYEECPEECPEVCAKWALMEYLMTAFHFIEGFLNGTFYPYREPSFMFKIIKPISSPPSGDHSHGN